MIYTFFITMLPINSFAHIHYGLWWMMNKSVPESMFP